MTSRIDVKQIILAVSFLSNQLGDIQWVARKKRQIQKKEEEIKCDLLETARFNWIGRC